MLRGWSGVFLTIVFLESCRLIRSNKVKIYQFILVLLILIPLYPLILLLKLFIRGNLTNGLLSFYENINENLIDLLPFGGFIEIINNSTEQLFQRLHLLSSAIATYQLSERLSIDYYSGELIPFWLEGLHGSAIFRILDINTNVNLGVALAKYMDPLSIDVNWNTNSTILGWLFVLPEYAAVYFIYTIITDYFC